MNFFFSILLILTITSCKKKNQEIVPTSKPIIELKNEIEFEHSEEIEKFNSTNEIIAIDFKKNKELLDIILLLPDSTFSSWQWKLNDRKNWYNEIKKNNYYINKTPNFFNKVSFEHYKATFTIIDGTWSINIYKTLENSFIVITDDIVGDGNTLNFYEVKSNMLKSYSDKNTIFSNIEEQLKNKEYDEDCKEKFEDIDNAFFNFNFTKINEIEIENSWYLTKENYKNCLIGNAIIYNFNPRTKKFEIEKIYWKPKREE